MHLADTSPHDCACEQYKTVAPVGDRVLVKVDVSEAKSTGGILLPTSAQKKPTQGEITSVGSAKAVKACALALSGCSSATIGTSLLHLHCCILTNICARMHLQLYLCTHAVSPEFCLSRMCCKALQEMVPRRLLLRSCPGVRQSGEKVVYSKYAGTELKMANTEYVLLKVSAPARDYFAPLFERMSPVPLVGPLGVPRSMISALAG